MGFEQDINRFDAIEMERQHKRESDERYRREQNRREKQLFRKDVVTGALRLMAAGTLVFCVLLGADGLRREGDELRARLARTKGEVDLFRRNTDGPINASEGTPLVSEERIETKTRGVAVLTFPEGSSLRVDNNSRFQVRQLDFYRPNSRNRSFLLESGSVLCRLSPRFGANGQCIISTEDGVVAARAGGFTVRHSSGGTQVEVVDGLVVLKNGEGRLELRGGMRGTLSAGSVPGQAPLDLTTKRNLATQLTHLRSFESGQLTDGLVPMERGLLGFLNPLLQKVGVVSGGWSIADNDDARLLAAATQLKNIAKAIETSGAPGTLSLSMLTELSMDKTERDRALFAFAGAILDGYQRRGAHSYVIRVRARDSKQTPYILTEKGIRQGK